jgi:UDP-N-acetylglucosamine--N-acetylmuramyl-(pentapeptide) pyrophosphoryl-undecaprenol N-acetylglucosamine transferase
MQQRGMSPRADGIWVRDYIDDMPRCMAAADLVICRCGAMTLSELPAAGKPSILIPSPYVAENHQYHNAMALVDKGAAVCIEEKDLSGDTLWEALCGLMDTPEKLRQMGENARAAAILDASDRIYAVIEETLQRAKN